MAQSHFSLVWDRYQSSICSSFSALQQNGDFVDLTLAADGHLVKVHQLILGAASPYLKELIQSAPCKHPVIFLNEVSYSTMCSLLQYVYTGEVAIPEENLTLFLEAAKALHIQGLDGTDMSNETSVDAEVDTKKNIIQNINIQLPSDDSSSTQIQKVSLSIPANTMRLSGQLDNTPESAKKKFPINITMANKRLHQSIDTSGNIEVSTTEESFGEEMSIDGSSPSNSASNFELTRLVELSPNTYTNSKELQYTVSNRGSLQLILNRYMYNLFSKSSGGQLRRWRCVDYRDQKCPACTVTNGNVVVQRTRMHNHTYHDKKILAKIEKKAVYSAIKSVNAQTDSQM